MAVNAQGDPVKMGHMFTDLANESAKIVGSTVAYGVWNVDYGRPSLDNCLNDFA